MTIEMFEADLEENLEALGEVAEEGQEARRRSVGVDREAREPEKRPLGDSNGSRPGGADRAAARAEPIFERDFAAQSYGFRPQSSAKDALRRVAELLKAGTTRGGRGSAELP